MKIETDHATRSSATSYATTTNPKDILGSAKVSLTAVPSVAILHEACALMTGDWKYGAYNWRAKPVVARIYIDAALRHIHAWFDGEECAEDSGVHHLGHARACLAILLDAMETGNLIDDRPILPGQLPFADLLEFCNDWVKESKGPLQVITRSESEMSEMSDAMKSFKEYIDEAAARNEAAHKAAL